MRRRRRVERRRQWARPGLAWPVAAAPALARTNPISPGAATTRPAPAPTAAARARAGPPAARRRARRTRGEGQGWRATRTRGRPWGRTGRGSGAALAGARTPAPVQLGPAPRNGRHRLGGRATRSIAFQCDAASAGAAAAPPTAHRPGVRARVGGRRPRRRRPFQRHHRRPERGWRRRPAHGRLGAGGGRVWGRGRPRAARGRHPARHVHRAHVRSGGIAVVAHGVNRGGPKKREKNGRPAPLLATSPPPSPTSPCPPPPWPPPTPRWPRWMGV